MGEAISRGTFLQRRLRAVEAERIKRVNGGVTRHATLILYCSVDGEEPWALVLPTDVPKWILNPEIIGHLVVGEMCRDPALADTAWYRAEQVKPH